MRSTFAPAARTISASAAPHRSTAALSVLGDSSRTSVSIVSISESTWRSQYSRTADIEAYNIEMRAAFLLCVGLCWSVAGGTVSLSGSSVAQTPQPFPKVGAPKPATPPPTQAPALPSVQPPQPAPGPNDVPTEEMLGVTIYPGAAFLASYDAGRGQRYYLFGTNAGFLEIVNYYRTVLKQKGELVYEEPAIHQFDIGKFKEETMAFPPSVTVKDYTWGGSAGYLNPKRGKQPERFKTVIQIVPAPAVQP